MQDQLNKTDADVPLAFGVWLKQRRKALDLTQDALARRVGCARITLQKIEAELRRPSRQLADRIIQQLDLAAEERRDLVQAPGIDPQHSRSPTNVPVALTTLIGRADEIAAVHALLRRDGVRLVTLTGPGGTGKTRLAQAVAMTLLGHFADGVRFVDLTPLADPALVAAAVASSLGVSQPAGSRTADAPAVPSSERLTTYLRAKQILLVVDNFEHVLSSAPLLAQLLKAASQLKLLVTSRAPLHLYGEHEFPVAPLPLPDLARLPSLDDLPSYPAIALFLQRAQAVKPDFRLAGDNAVAIAEICVRLDGLPLAIELAAARVKIFPPRLLLHQLNHALSFLIDGPCDLHPRHQTLRGAIDWSYQLLDAEEQRLFRRLGVFAGGCSIEAVESVCFGDWSLGDQKRVSLIPNPQPLTPGVVLQSLVDHSLLRAVETPAGEPRFAMLETIRAFAREQLEASGEAPTVHHRLATYLLALATATPLTGPRNTAWLARLELEHDNLRTALHWALREAAAPDQVELALKLAGAVWEFWQQHDHESEGLRWLETALARSWSDGRAAGDIVAGDRQHAADRAKALRGAVSLALRLNDPRAAVWNAESLALFRLLDDKFGVAWGLSDQGALETGGGRSASAVRLHEESLALFQEVGSAHGAAWALNMLGNLALMQRDTAPALRRFEESLALFRALGDKDGVAATLWRVGSVAWLHNDLARAESLYQESLAHFRAVPSPSGVAASLNYLSQLALAKGETGRAAQLQEESLAIWRGLDDMLSVAWSLNVLAETALAEGSAERAAALAEESLALHRTLECQPGVAMILNLQAEIALGQGDAIRARSVLAESLPLCRRLPGILFTAQCIAGIAGVALAHGDPVRAAKLMGSVVAMWSTVGELPRPLDWSRNERRIAALRDQLDETAWNAAWSEGQTMSLEDAIAYACDEG